MTSFTAAAIESTVTMADSEASQREIDKQREANLDRASPVLDWILKHRYPSVWADEPAPPPRRNRRARFTAVAAE